MTIKEYQKLVILDSGSTTYERDLVELFNLKLDNNIEKTRKKLMEVVQVNDFKLGRRIWFNNKYWKWEKDLLDQTFEQWIRLDQLIADEDNIKNLHKLLSIYFRPCNIFGKIKKYKLSEQDKLSDELLELNMDIAQSLMVFFYLNVLKFLNYTKIPYLNQMRLK